MDRRGTGKCKRGNNLRQKLPHPYPHEDVGGGYPALSYEKIDGIIIAVYF